MSSSSMKYNICIVSNQLAGGGAERCSALLSQFLEKNNCSVHHVIVIDKIEFQFSGKILNLGKLKKEGYNLKDRIHRFFTLFLFLKNNRFDYIIDTRVKSMQWQELIITKCVYNAPLILVVHSFMTELYFPKFKFLAKNIYKKSFNIIAVSDLIKEKIQNNFQYKKVETIYNAVDLQFINQQLNEDINVGYNYIVAVGNMHIDVKQFDKLIIAYSKSKLIDKNIKLVIIGEGVLLPSLELLSNELNLSDLVVFKRKINNVFPYFKNALFSVLSSKNEGFPMVLLESLACETPVVSFDCLSGPSEIISNYENGILVENQNFDQLTLAMNLMIKNNELYLHCKHNAKSSVERFSIEKIGKQWLDLMKIKK